LPAFGFGMSTCASSPAFVDEPTATVLRNAVARETVIVALSIDDRERILRALDDPPAGLAELRRVLLRGTRVEDARGTGLAEVA
jgi:hypothetical protein